MFCRANALRSNSRVLRRRPHFFELRARLLAGTIPTARSQPIDIKLSIVLGAIRAHFQSTLKADEGNLLTKALAVRNKLLHCEFSTAHAHLNQSSFAVCLRQVPVREDQVPPAAAPSRAAITAFGEKAPASGCPACGGFRGIRDDARRKWFHRPPKLRQLGCKWPVNFGRRANFAGRKIFRGGGACAWRLGERMRQRLAGPQRHGRAVQVFR
jgi:hypothetical protein